MKESYEGKWGYFSPRFGFGLMLNRGGYFDQRYSVTIHFIWGLFNLILPIKTSIPEGCDPPRYGIQIHSGTLWLHLGGDMREDINQCDSRWITWELPFVTWIHEWHKMADQNKQWVLYDFDKSANEYTETHSYKYKLKSGDVQEVDATCSVRWRSWHRKWAPFIKKESRCINITFSDEIGERTGSWKGGTIGCDYELIEGESILACLRRMEKERTFR